MLGRSDLICWISAGVKQLSFAVSTASVFMARLLALAESWSERLSCASKAGAAMLTACLHLEEGHHGIRAMGLSPGTVATQMQREIKGSGINPVSQLDWSAHIPADWPARTLLWMCGAEADPFLGTEISLRDEDIRKRVGLA